MPGAGIRTAPGGSDTDTRSGRLTGESPGPATILPRVVRRLSLTLVVLALLMLVGAGSRLRPDVVRDTLGPATPIAAGAPTQATPVGCPPAGFTQLDGGHIRMPGGAKPGATRLLVAIMSGSDGDLDDNLKLAKAANYQGIAVLYPTVRAGSRIWQLNDAMGVSDVVATTGLIQRTLATGCFDPNRISIVGLSNGAGFATRMACKLPAQFAAVVAVAAGYRALDPCPAVTRASFLAIHGTADTIVPFNGRAPDFAGNVPRYAAGWAGRDGCAPSPIERHPRPLVTRIEYGGCPAGMRVEVLRLTGTDHGWPGAPPPWPRRNPSGVDANLEILRYIRHAARPAG
ncbi:MAG: polyhydroxybutyrate depolymerase [Solirubrobacteraceae bacterium]|nr:polyhydroxybutyrate depolymerase [Solirubrobacteraceae bacterium]